HDVLALDVGSVARLAGRGRRPGARRETSDAYAGHGTVAGQHVDHADALDHPHAEVLRPAGQRLGEVDRVDPAVVGHVEAGQEVVGLRPGEEVGHLPGRDLVDL